MLNPNEWPGALHKTHSPQIMTIENALALALGRTNRWQLACSRVVVSDWHRAVSSDETAPFSATET